MKTIITLYISVLTAFLHTSAVQTSAQDAPPQATRVQKLLKEMYDPTSKHVMVAAHRADWHDAPENSLAGIASCIEMGADFVEIDLRQTKDGQFVLMHDKTLERTSNGTGRVDKLTVAQLKQFRLKDKDGKVTDEQIPTLEEVINACRGKILMYLDKSEDNIDDVYAKLVATKSTDNAFFYGRRSVAELRTRYGSLVDQIAYLPKVGDDTQDLNRYIESFSSAQKGVKNGGAYLIEFKTDESPVVKAIPVMRATGARVWASPLWVGMCAWRTDELALKDPDANWGWLLEKGVNMFCTDRPRELLTYLRAKGRHD